MAQRITPEQARTWFAEHLKRRLDYGLGNAVLSLMFHPGNPFSPKQRRKFKTEFLLGVAWIGVAIALFVFFNFGISRF
jgi:hypothetical protein